jgi:hypothetical protein
MYKTEKITKKVLENGQISQEQTEELVSIALQVLKSLLTDTETPIEIRLRVSLEIFENFCATPNVNSGSGNNDEGELIRGLEKTAHDIEKNAHHLSYIETLLTMAAKHKKHESVLRNEEKIINN